jgi:polyphosphate kinase
MHRKPSDREAGTPSSGVSRASGAFAAPALGLDSPSSPGTTRASDVEDRVSAIPMAVGTDLSAPELYLNRELTWLEFNRRVLRQAEDPRIPLLERLKFLSIAMNALNEFVMKRIGGLKQQVAAGVQDRTVDGRTPRQQIEACHVVIRERNEHAQRILLELTRLLTEQGIVLARYAELTDAQKGELRDYYIKNIFPLVTPQAVDPAHPFPFVSNLSLNLLVTLRHSEDDPQGSLARVKVPIGAGIQRFLRLRDTSIFARLEEVIAGNLDLLFPGMSIESCEIFRVTRNADTERDEEKADDLLALIETELRDRKFAPIVRLEVGANMSAHSRGMLAAELELDADTDVFEIDGMLGLRDLMEVVVLDRPELHDPPHHPLDHPDLVGDRSIFHIIRDRKGILLHHPYQSFAASVERLLREASDDPKVRAIKMTLYRTSEDSKVIAHLINAARNGKQVAVVVELKARFDEEANIRWANHLESFGIHVTYGVVGLKTHCKVILVVRQDFDGLRRYCHFGTGNYHSGTARHYADLGMLTCDDELGHDVTELFNYLTTGYKPRRRYNRILPAPKMLKPALLRKIKREVDKHSEDAPGLIQMKVNALEDRDIVEALYRASQAGVKIDLIVRDTCRLRPGVEHVSENVRVISIVGRFLEHARIYYFKNGGDEEYFTGSADLMQRNLESRVECIVPIIDPQMRVELRSILDAQLADQRNAWDMHSDGTYVLRSPTGDSKGCQDLFIEHAEKKLREATRLRRRLPKGLARRHKGRLE